MLPNHMPFVVAEQFALLEALHPAGSTWASAARRAPTRPPRRRCAASRRYLTVEQFPEHLQTLLALLGDERIDRERRGCRPRRPPSYPEVWMLGSSTYGAQVAAALGLPFCYAYHFAMSSDVDTALHLYRPASSRRRASRAARHGQRLGDRRRDHRGGAVPGRPSRIMALSLRTGRLGPIVSPERGRGVELSDSTAACSTAARHPVRGHRRRGGGGLDELVERTGADELILAGTVYDPATRQDTLARVAKAWGL
jgi:alkanesulfonate monooxygenase SsuD/methylene tetrahydromethanopterin reductase-like flavin-dependent oxidoreductase (luciferase family)